MVNVVGSNFLFLKKSKKGRKKVYKELQREKKKVQTILLSTALEAIENEITNNFFS